jgi:hypothetical protein
VDQYKDFTSTSFGYIIAFLLPGVTVIYAGTFYFSGMRSTMDTFERSGSNIGLFLLITLAALAIGLILTPIRALIYEEALGGESKLEKSDFQKLDAKRLGPFRAVVDEQYRYHQFWGSMSLALPVLFSGLAVRYTDELSWPEWIASVAVALGIEGATVWAACASFSRYVWRAKAILNQGS